MNRAAPFSSRVLLPLLFAVMAAPLWAAEGSIPAPLDLDTVADFTVYQTVKTAQLHNDETYAEITPDQRSRALTLMTEIGAIIDRSGSITAMPPLPSPLCHDSCPLF